MSNAEIPAQNFTPNAGLVSDPKKRRVIQWVLGVFGVLLGAAVSVDLASPELDFSVVTTPATAAYAWLNVTFGFGGTLPNIPKL